MNRFLESTLFGLLVLIASALPVAAAEFLGLGFTLSPDLGSSATGLSSDGKIVVGQSGLVSGEPKEAFRWTRDAGIEGLGGDPSSSFGTAATDAALNGAVVGYSFLEAFEWGPDNVLHVLPGFSSPGSPPSTTGQAIAISDDAQWIVGNSWDPAGHWRAARWNTDRQISPLPFSYAYDVSEDGSVTVGANTDALMWRAVRWTEADGLQELGELPGRPNSSAGGVSADGTVIVGQAWATAYPSPPEPFRWTAAGGMVGLSLLSGFDAGAALAASGDGSVIVGYNDAYSEFGDEQTSAVIWIEQSGPLELSEHFIFDVGLAEQLTGWQLTSATRISRDGQVIVGNGINPQGNREAWMAVVPEPGSGALATIALVMATLLSLRHTDWRWRENQGHSTSSPRPSEIS